MPKVEPIVIENTTDEELFLPFVGEHSQGVHFGPRAIWGPETKWNAVINWARIPDGLDVKTRKEWEDADE